MSYCYNLFKLFWQHLLSQSAKYAFFKNNQDPKLLMNSNVQWDIYFERLNSKTWKTVLLGFSIDPNDKERKIRTLMVKLNETFLKLFLRVHGKQV